ncbi:MAG: DUF4159 domain-containing protein [bacterium]|nr:DUF4159 domain-containing protein [bacterium]
MSYLAKILTVTALAVLLIIPAAQAQRDIMNLIGAAPKTPQEAAMNPNPSAVKVARLHYSGGGDWYWGSSAIPNFLRYLHNNTSFPVDTIERQVTIMDPELFQYPFLFATGHGVIKFGAEEKERLREYLLAGGFLFVNDSYGMDQNFRAEMSELFPEREVVDIPFEHPIYHCFYDFPNGPPKIHEHDGNPPRGYGLVVNGRLVLYFLVESDIGDGWEDAQVHSDPPELREKALKMGVNILSYAMLY